MNAAKEQHSFAAATELIDAGHGVVLNNLNWQSYQRLLHQLNGHKIRFTYDQGRFETMPTSFMHGFLCWLLSHLMEAWVEEMHLPLKAGRDMTFEREQLDRGISPDDCYWITNASKVRGKQTLDFTIDPPPDLALEIEVSRTVLSRAGVYAALGVGELWRSNGDFIKVGLLGPDGAYRWGDHSALFPNLPIDKLREFLRMGLDTEDDLESIRKFRAWVRQFLADSRAASTHGA